jgi:basic amino acid/polyamine antiporter, APA family
LCIKWACGERKSVEQSIAETDEPTTRLRKDLTAKDLTIFGVAVVVASLPSRPARPARSRAFILAAIACGLAALCYAEFASTLPVAGSAYTFFYARFGEFVAWIIGWDLILEVALAAAVVAKGWSLYLGSALGVNRSTTVQIGSIDFDWAAVAVIVADHCRPCDRCEGLVTSIGCHHRHQRSQWSSLSSSSGRSTST